MLHYSFDGNVLDSSGNGRNGTVTGAVSYESLSCGTGIRFNNPVGGQDSTQYVSVPDLSPVGVGSFTIALRLRSTDTAQTNGRVFGNHSNIPGVIFNYNRGASPNAGISVNFNGGSGLPIFFDTTSGPESRVTDGNCHWMILVVDRSSQTVRAYIDGLMQQQAAPSLGAVPLSQLRIGGSVSSGISSGTFFGARLTTVEDFRIYDTALNDCQIASIRGLATDPIVATQPASTTACVAGTATFFVTISSTGPFTYQWRHRGTPIDTIANPSAATATLTLTNVQAADAGSYDCVVTNDCGSVTSNAADLDVYCECPTYSVLAGSIDNFALPADPATRSASFTDALNNQNQRAFLKFDEMPGVTAGTVGDQNIAQSFTNIPSDLLSATLTFRAKSGPDINPGAEGTDRMRLGFASGSGNNAAFDIRWERFFGIGNATDAFLPGVAWGGSIDRTIALDLTALPKASQQGGGTINVLPQMIASETLDFVVDDDSAVDYMQLTGVRSGNGQKVAWVRSQPTNHYGCVASNQSFSVTAAGTGPFTYEWRKDGVAIDLGANPSAATATLTLTNVQTTDVGAYDCIVTGACGSITSNAATLTVCAGDINCDQGVDFGDFLAFFNCYDAETPCADIDGNPGVDFGDFLAFFNAYDVGC